MSSNTDFWDDIQGVGIFEHLRVAWQRKWWILVGTLLITFAGFYHAMTAPEVFESRAIIAPKESQGGTSAVLSHMGGLGGVFASQLGISSSNPDRIQILLNDYKLCEDMIRVNNLLPRLFPERWDTESLQWKSSDSSMVPDIAEGVDRLQTRVLSSRVNSKANVISVMAVSSAPEQARDYVQMALDALNTRMRRDVMEESSRNQDYLLNQLQKVNDPVLREKIQSMLAAEIERAMFVSVQSFEVLQSPSKPLYRVRPKKKQIVILSFLMGISLSLTVLYVWQLVARLRGETAMKGGKN